MIVALSGYAGTGKDTVGDFLVEHYDFKRLAFADPMREMALAINPIISHHTEPAGMGNVVRPIRLSYVVHAFGWRGAKDHFPEVRRFLQHLGTDAGRNVLGENVWVNATLEHIARDPGHSWVLTDCRFVNEANAVVWQGGEVWRVTRPGVGPANDHISEVGLDDWNFDRVIENHGDIADLHAYVDALMTLAA